MAKYTDLEAAQLCLYVYNNRPDGECADIEYIVRGDAAFLRGTGRDLGRYGRIGFLKDLWRDIRIWPWYSSEIGWHPAGFLKASIQLADKFEQLGIKRLYGHSLGGATALLTAAILAHRGCEIISVVVFGSPRCGKLPSLDNVPVRLYVGVGDLVAAVPPYYKPIREPKSLDTGGHSLFRYIRELSD